MAQRRFGSGTSSLLRSASAAAEKTATYNDQIAAYEFDLSEKSAEDYAKYQKYLEGRISKVQQTDASKALSLQKTLTGAYRKFNSSEIFRTTLAVNYGQASNRDKYNKLYSLFQSALQNGDESLAQSIEGQLARLDITIQNEDAARASRAAAGAASAVSATKTQLQDFENKIDRAYQTGQKVKVDGVEKQLNATDYLLVQANIMRKKYEILYQQAQSDPKYADDLSRLEKSDDFRNLIDSGIVKFDANGQAVPTEHLDNVAVKFKKDEKTGVIKRDYTYVNPIDGKRQEGLIKPEEGSGKQLYVANRALNKEQIGTDPKTGSPIYAPSIKGRVAYDLHDLKIDDKNVQGVGVYSDLISGNRVAVQKEGPGKGLRATAYYDKSSQRQVSDEELKNDLASLVNAKQYKAGPFDGLLDTVNKFSGPEWGGGLKKVGETLKTRAGLNSLTSPLGTLQNLFMKNTIEQKRRDVERKQQESLAAAYAAQQANLARLRASAPPPAPIRALSKPVLPGPRIVNSPFAAPADRFQAALQGTKKTDSDIAKAIGNAVGYRF